MKTIAIISVLAAVASILTLLLAVMDSATRLDQCRQQNLTHVERCELLVKLVNSRLRGMTSAEAAKVAGPDAIVKLDGTELWIDDIVLRVENDRILEVDLDSSCHY